MTVEGVEAAVKAKSRPTTRHPFTDIVTTGLVPLTLFPIATGAEVMEVTGPKDPAPGRAGGGNITLCGRVFLLLGAGLRCLLFLGMANKISIGRLETQ